MDAKYVFQTAWVHVPGHGNKYSAPAGTCIETGTNHNEAFGHAARKQTNAYHLSEAAWTLWPSG